MRSVLWVIGYRFVQKRSGTEIIVQRAATGSFLSGSGDNFKWRRREDSELQDWSRCLLGGRG